MRENKIAVTTMTWARDAEEEKLLRESLTYLARLNIPVFVTDGGSNDEFVNFLQAFPHFTLCETTEKGLWAQVRCSLRAAYQHGAEVILYTEPDKRDFFREHLMDFIAAAPDEEKVWIVLAARSAKSFASFPQFQQHTETTINRCCGEVTGQNTDYTYGPFLLRHELVPALESVAADIGWGWRPYAFGIAHKLGYRIEQFIADFACPPEQREDSAAERIYRIKQLEQSVRGLLLSTKEVNAMR